MDLSKKKCAPCKGEALKGKALQDFYQQLSKSGWSVVDEHHLEKEYSFSNFREALAFTNQVAEIAEEQKHHPDIFLSYGKVKLQIWTHKINGLTENDFILAAKCDQISH